MSVPLPGNQQRWIAVLGREDRPTDALEDYCKRLAQSLRTKGCSLELFRVPWAEQGWRRALRATEKRFAAQRGSWALMQYTALSWSRHGFPLRFVSLIDRLKRSGSRILIVFHEPEPFGGSRSVDRLRRWMQLEVMRSAARQADKIVSTSSPERISWMHDPAIRAKTIALPVGSNLPVTTRNTPALDGRLPVVVIFGTTALASEVAMIASVLRGTAEEIGPIHFTVFGRGSKAVGAQLRPLLAGSRVELEDLGILEPEQASSILAGADVQLFIRSGLSPCRTTAVAGIVCGLPVVGFSDRCTEFPITEAGVRLVPRGDREGLIRELVSVLKEPALREALRRRNLEAAERYFSWDRIADAYLAHVCRNG